jgi:hypothetical protein
VVGLAGVDASLDACGVDTHPLGPHATGGQFTMTVAAVSLFNVRWVARAVFR